MKLIVDFSSAKDFPVDQVGGKALSLIAMDAKGFPVPSGFVLTADFFNPWISQIREHVEWEVLIAADTEDSRQASRTLKSICQKLAFSSDQYEVFEQFLTMLQGYPEQLFAVRSSSPEEDLEGSSFAGGYETTLGVSLPNLEAAIRNSFASLFDERIIVYKREQGIQLEHPSIAVIVQQQIAADSAGVAFSLNPMNNCYDEAVINANFGLGESVVSGVIEPDHFVVDKFSNEILDTQLGKKEMVITLNSDGGITQNHRDQDQQASISPDEIIQITNLLLQVEEVYHHPVDIEWAICNEELFLLQVRPITTYLPLPEEMITAPGEPKRLYADSTLIEQGIQQPLSVLGTEFLRHVLNTMTGPMGGNADSVDSGAFTAGGRYYMNLSKSLRMAGPAGALAPGSAGDESVMSILDNMDMDPYLSENQSPREILKTISGPLRIIPMMLPALKALRNPEWILEKYHQALPAHLEKIDQVMDENSSLEQLATRLTGLLNFFFYEFGLPLVFAPLIAQNRIKKMFPDDSDEVSAHILSLGTALPGNKTAEMGALMMELAALEPIKTHASAETFLPLLEQRKLDPDFLNRWDEFIAEFGYRCPREIDVATPRMNENPLLLFEQLKGMSAGLDQPEGSGTIFEEARAKRETAYQALKEIAGQKGPRQVKMLDRFYKTWVTLGGFRETPKHYVIKIVDLFRKRVLDVAETLVHAGRLDDLDQIFDLTIVDIDQALADPTLDLRSLAAERTALIKKIQRSHHVARILDSRGMIFFPPRKAVKEGELAGVPISAGVVQGRVKVLHSAEGAQLLPGEILVTRATDPGWTPLFINAGGIILEIGGALQHGAVVAREYGLPCVSGLDRATELLSDGQFVEVDGSNGIVRVLDGEIPPARALSEAEIQKMQAAIALRKKAGAQRNRQQALLRIIPVVLLPFLVLCIAAVGYMVVNLLMGYSFSETTQRLTELWQVSSPILIGITNIIAIPILLTTLWRFRKKLMAFVGINRNLS